MNALMLVGLVLIGIGLLAVLLTLGSCVLQRRGRTLRPWLDREHQGHYPPYTDPRYRVGPAPKNDREMVEELRRRDCIPY